MVGKKLNLKELFTYKKTCNLKAMERGAGNRARHGQPIKEQGAGDQGKVRGPTEAREAEQAMRGRPSKVRATACEQGKGEQERPGQARVSRASKG